MWLVVDYEPVSAFGLRPSNTTANGGKSLICPTPYAMKMGLLDRIIRFGGEEYGREVFPIIRDLQFYIKLPMATAINRTFQRIQDYKSSKKDNEDNEDEAGEQSKFWKSSISQREYCFQTGLLRIATETTPEFGDVLLQAFSAINYFGRKGSFMQLVGYEPNTPFLPEGFVNVSQPTSGLQRGFLQRMDDMEHITGEGKKQRPIVFDDVSVLNPKASGARRSYTVVFPYELAYNGQNHTVYHLKGR
jgi:hypothetical protein